MTDLARAVAIVGPTAAGKSSLALAVAEPLGLPILCCDSVQIYRGLDIGAAKPSAEDRSRVPHRLLDLVDPDQRFSAGEYGALAQAELARGPAIICGGTGLYLRATGWTYSGRGPGDASPETDEACNPDRGDRRVQFESQWMAREASEAGAIHRALCGRDPETAAGIHPHNVVRALRSLWLCEHHQAPISAVRRQDPPRPVIELLMVVIDPGVAAVDAAIDRRCEAMLTRGWLAEVEKLVAAGYDARYKAMRSLGYRELLDHIHGRSSLEQAKTAIQRATRNYARRQRTYFRHQFKDLLPMARIVNIDHPDAFPVARVAAFLAGETGLDTSSDPHLDRGPA
ncbi:tRNA (adenosine(37)-N6)-dimethylallyltransferase MiaA [Enhygromyxa salina]|uniref:tRNA dimethylallyltransferase n=1 Tax=Enhygromyxa salina TaxID=215803 RepID=A0A2S9Y2H4_9BACT|nr:tRNA (adenosine(37)-N6)-dimethylallyltransferase MiaA [Enhygromyxa salina]PRP99304.1 tRNA dimethylallyltransferase [Enhygromyxa salina]